MTRRPNTHDPGYRNRSRTYHIEEKDGRYYVYYYQIAPVEVLFEVAHTREQAEQAIQDHKDGKHSTQEFDQMKR